MTAPGMNLEFTASTSFRARLGGRKELLQAVKDVIRHRPKGAAHGQPCFYVERLTFADQALGVVYHRTGNRIGSVEIYLLPAETTVFEKKLRHFGVKENG